MKRIGILCIFLLALLALPLGAGAEGDWQYRLDENGLARITAYTGSERSAKVPEWIDGIAVAGMDGGAVLAGQADSVLVPTGLYALDGDAIAPGITVRARHGSPALIWAEGSERPARNVSTRDFSDLVRDLTGSACERTAEGWRVSAAYAQWLTPGMAVFLPQTGGAWRITSIIRDEQYALLQGEELDPLLTYNEVIVRIGAAYAGMGAGGGVHMEDGVAVAIYQSDDSFTLKSPDLEIVSAAVTFKNLTAEIRLNTAQMANSLEKAGFFSETVEADESVSALDISQPFVEKILFQIDYDISTERNNHWRGAFDHGVHEVEIGAMPIPIGDLFSVKLFGMLQITNYYDTSFTMKATDGRIGFQYDGATGAWTNLSHSPTGGFETNTIHSSTETALNIGVSLDFAECVTIAELVFGPSWTLEVDKTEDTEYPGTMNCVDVTWDGHWRFQVTLTPGVDFTALPFVRGLLRALHIPFDISYKYYWSNDIDLGDGLSMGSTVGLVTSFYLTKEFQLGTIQIPLRVDGVPIQPGFTQHFELNSAGKYVPVDLCTHRRKLVYDSCIPGDIPLVVDFTWGWTSTTTHLCVYEPYQADKKFLGWYDEAGNLFFDEYGCCELNWKGTKTIYAHWETREGFTDNGHPYFDYSYPGNSYHFIARMINTYYGSCIEIDGTCSDPANMYLSNVMDAWEAFYVHGDSSYGFSGVWEKDLLTMPLWARLGANSSTPDIVLNDPIIGTYGISNNQYIRSITCNDNMKECGNYSHCPNLVSVKLSANSELPGSLDNNVSLQNVVLSQVITSLPNFENCISLSSLEIPPSIKYIYGNTLANTGFITFTIPETVTEVHKAFPGCKRLQEVKSEGMLDVFEAGFDGCTALEKIDISSRNITGNFMNLPNLDTLTIHGTDTVFATKSLAQCSAKHLTIDIDNTATIYGEISGDQLESVTIEADAITYSLEIRDCSRLKELTVRIHSVNNDESLLIDNCPLLTSLKVEYAGKVTVRNCPQLTDADLAEGIQHLNCYSLVSLETLTVPDGVQSIRFYNCPSLSSISVPEDLALPESVFDGAYPEVHRRIATSLYIPDLEECFPLHFESDYGPKYSDQLLPAGATIVLFGIEKQQNFTLRGWAVNGEMDSLLQPGDTFTMPGEETTLRAVWTDTSITVSNGVFTEYWRDQGLKNLVLPREVTEIAAQSVPSGIVSLYIPDSVITISPLAFVNAVDLESIKVSPNNPNFYVMDNALYTKDGTLLAVPRHRGDDTLIIAPNTVAISGEAFGGLWNTDSLSTVHAIFFPATVETIGDNWWGVLPEDCMFYGPEESPIKAAILEKGFSYNLYPIFFLSDGTVVGMILIQQGDQVPDISLSEEGRTFMGWSLTEDGPAEAGPITVPLGGLELYAVWDGEAPVTDELPIQGGPAMEEIAVPNNMWTGWYGNALHSYDTALRAYLDAETYDALWEESQTLPEWSVTLTSEADFEWTWGTTEEDGRQDGGLLVSLLSLPEHAMNAVFEVQCTWNGRTGTKQIELPFVEVPMLSSISMDSDIWLTKNKKTPVEVRYDPAGWTYTDHRYFDTITYPATDHISWDLITNSYEDGVLYLTAAEVGDYPCAVLLRDGSVNYITYITVHVLEGDVLRLPAALSEIETEAFAGAGMQAVCIPSGCRSIGSRAFADCRNLTVVYIPDGDLEIAADAFDGSPVTIVSSSDAVRSWAENNGVSWRAE